MHPYLLRLGVRPEAAAFFRPFYRADKHGDLVFDYDREEEHFGLAFHRLPVTDNFWMAGNFNFSVVRHVFICGYALDAVAFLSLHTSWLKNKDSLLFLGTGAVPRPAHLAWCRQKLKGQNLHLLFPNDLTGRACDLKLAASWRSLPLAISFADTLLFVNFRNKVYEFEPERFSLNALEKRSGYRFDVRTPKSRLGLTFLDELKIKASFNP